jgi:hypothetical protein
LRMRAAAGGQGEQPRVACTNPWRCKGAGWCVLGQQGWWAVRGGCRAGIDRVEAACSDVMRSYQGYYTRSHQNSAVKRLWAGIVLGWVTSREVPVLHPHTSIFCVLRDFPFMHLLHSGAQAPCVSLGSVLRSFLCPVFHSLLPFPLLVYNGVPL